MLVGGFASSERGIVSEKVDGVSERTWGGASFLFLESFEDVLSSDEVKIGGFIGRTLACRCCGCFVCYSGRVQRFQNRLVVWSKCCCWSD